MLIDPHEDIKEAMHKQKTAGQERWAMRLLATGEFEAAEQQKLATIQRAEGEREAAIKVAEGKAEAIRLVNEAAGRYFRGNAQALKQIEMTESALRDNAKIVIAGHGASLTLLLGGCRYRWIVKREPPGVKRQASNVSQSINVFVVDDHDVVRKGLRFYLSAHPEIVIGGEAGEARSAVGGE